jgi:hypothetical protein
VVGSVFRSIFFGLVVQSLIDVVCDYIVISSVVIYIRPLLMKCYIWDILVDVICYVVVPVEYLSPLRVVKSRR